MLERQVRLSLINCNADRSRAPADSDATGEEQVWEGNEELGLLQEDVPAGHGVAEPPCTATAGEC